MVSLALLSGCKSIAGYDQVAYQNATACKAECLLLMDKATTGYSSNHDAIEQTHLDLIKAYEYDKGRGSNQLTVKLWDVLLDPQGNLWGGFMARWKTKGSLSAAYVVAKKEQVASAFDQISGLEIGK